MNSGHLECQLIMKNYAPLSTFFCYLQLLIFYHNILEVLFLEKKKNKHLKNKIIICIIIDSPQIQLYVPEFLLSTLSWASLVAQLVKNPPAMQYTWVPFLGLEDPLEKGKATHSSILVWRIPWTVHGFAKSQTQLSDFHSLIHKIFEISLPLFSMNMRFLFTLISLR